MAPKKITIWVNVKLPKRPTLKMVVGVFMVWLSGNPRYFLKYGWPYEIVDGKMGQHNDVY